MSSNSSLRRLTLRPVAGALALSLVLVGTSAAASPRPRPGEAAPEAASPQAAAPRTSAPRTSAKNLKLTAPVVVALVDADAAFKRLPPNDFVGLRDAYYAYDSASSAYWAAAEVVPSPSAYQAEVSSQDDGGYTVFHQVPHAAWVATDDGLAGAMGTTCAAYHVSVPAPVLAVWHWAAGRCTPPPNFGTGPLLLTYFAQASEQWSAGATAISAGQAGHWLAAARDLRAAVAAKAEGTNGYPTAAGQLVSLSKLPDAMQTPAQSRQAGSLTEALNSFFGTNGLYGYSAPSLTPKAFAATLQEEANLGTLDVVPDPRLGKVPASFPEAAVTCPVLAGVTAGSVFGCKVAAFEAYYMVGTVTAAEATTYLGYIVGGRPVFDCKLDGLSASEQLAAQKMGGGCQT